MKPEGNGVFDAVEIVRTWEARAWRRDITYADETDRLLHIELGTLTFRDPAPGETRRDSKGANV